jgi:tRNA 2-thiouridine synthesizing protein A
MKPKRSFMGAFFNLDPDALQDLLRSSPVLIDVRAGNRIFGRRRESMNAGTEIRFDRELDTRGLNCPLPILRTKKSLNDMTSGQVLKVVATDPGSVRDFQAFSKQTGNQLLVSDENAGEYLFMLRKK